MLLNCPRRRASPLLVTAALAFCAAHARRRREVVFGNGGCRAGEPVLLRDQIRVKRVIFCQICRLLTDERFQTKLFHFPSFIHSRQGKLHSLGVEGAGSRVFRFDFDRLQEGRHCSLLLFIAAMWHKNVACFMHLCLELKHCIHCHKKWGIHMGAARASTCSTTYKVI